MAKVKIDDFIQMVLSILKANGLGAKEAVCVVDHLLDAELCEHPSHGFLRIPGIVNALRKSPPKQIVIEKETPVSALLNGGNNPGLVVALRAAETAVKKARKSHFCIVGGHGTTGTGAIGYYVRRIAEADLIGLMVCNSDGAIPAWGGIDPIMGTNPIACGIPTGTEPIIIDFASAKMTYGDMVIALKEGRQLPEDVLLDDNGNPTTDPRWAETGAFLPIAEHKGYALALMVEVLAGPLVKAKAGVKAVPGSWGFMVMAIDPSLLVSVDQFKSQVDSLVTEIKNSRRAPGVSEIFLPGERSNRKRAKNRELKYLDIPDQIVKDIEELSRS